MTDHPQCKTCRYWSSVPNEDVSGLDAGAIGSCRRRAPVVFTRLELRADDHWDGGDVENATCWPHTTAGMWCGEYEKAAGDAT